MKKIIKYWLEGFKVLLRFVLFYVVLKFFTSITMILLPIILLIPNGESQENKNLILTFLIISIVIIIPFVFYLTSQLTGLMQGKLKEITALPISSNNKEKGERLMKELRERKRNRNKNENIGTAK